MIPAVLAVLLVVVAAMAFSGGLVGGGDVDTTPSGGAATDGANGTVQQVLNQSRNVSQQNATVVVGARNTTTARNATATLNATPTRTVDPNSTPWNAAVGVGDLPHGGRDPLRGAQRRARAEAARGRG